MIRGAVSRVDALDREDSVLALGRVAAIRPYATTAALTLFSLGAAALLLYLGRNLTFFLDEWTFIDERSAWTWGALMASHNEHWSLGLALVYKTLLSVFGLTSYLPYLATLIAVHVATAAGVYRIVSYQSGPVVALAAATLLLFLGTGFEDLFWAFQIGFVGAAAAGTWGLALVLEPPTRARLVVATVLLVVAVATQGTGLFFLGAAIVVLVLQRDRWRDGWVVAPALVAYVAWYLFIGSAAVDAHRDPFTAQALRQLPDYIVTGASNAIGMMTALGQQFGLVVFGLLVVATVWHLIGPAPLRTAAVAGLAGLVAQFAVTGLVRAQFGAGQATAPRYVYIAAIFVLIAIAGWVGRRMVGSGYRGYLTLAVVVGAALLANGAAIWSGRDVFQGYTFQTVATVNFIQEYGGSPALPSDEGLFPIPGDERLDEIFDTYGAPETALARPVPDPIRDEIAYQLVGDRFTIAPSDAAVEAAETELAASADVNVAEAGGCVELHPSGPDPQAVFRVPAGEALSLTAVGGGELQAFLSLHGTYSEEASQRFGAAPGVTYRATVPDIGAGAAWWVRIDPPLTGPTRVCAP